MKWIFGRLVVLCSRYWSDNRHSKRKHWKIRTRKFESVTTNCRRVCANIQLIWSWRCYSRIQHSGHPFIRVPLIRSSRNILYRNRCQCRVWHAHHVWINWKAPKEMVTKTMAMIDGHSLNSTMITVRNEWVYRWTFHPIWLHNLSVWLLFRLWLSLNRKISFPFHRSWPWTWNHVST